MRVGLGMLAALTLGGAASAQGAGEAVTPAQMQVLKDCGPDLKTYCANVQPGGGRLGVCMRDNWTKLSPTCRQSVQASQAAGGGAAAAAGQGPTSQAAAAAVASTQTANPDLARAKAFDAFMKECGKELAPYCGGIAFTDPEFGACVRENFRSISQTCQIKLMRMPKPAR